MVAVEYLTIANFAEKAGVSKQAIYKQVNNNNSQIAPYVLREGKKILIKATALPALYGVDTFSLNHSTQTDVNVSTFTTQIDGNAADPATHEATQDNPPQQPNNPATTQENQPISTDYIDFLKAQVAELKAEKAEVEQRLNATIREKDGIIQEQSTQLAQLAQQVAQIADRALIATSQQQYLTAMEKNDKPETERIEAIQTDEIPIEKPKAGFLRRWFSGK
jgi:DNA-binding phage protein